MRKIIGLFFVLCLAQFVHAQKAKLQCASKVKPSKSCSIKNDSNKKLTDQSQEIKEICEKEHLSDRFIEAYEKLAESSGILNSLKSIGNLIKETTNKINDIKNILKAFTSGELKNQIEYKNKMYTTWQKGENLQKQGKNDLAKNEFDLFYKLDSEYQSKFSNFLSLDMDISFDPNKIEEYIYAVQKNIVILEKKKTAFEELQNTPNLQDPENIKLLQNNIIKVNIKYEIEKIKAGEKFTDCGLTNEEIYAINLYTASYYSPINSALRSGNKENLNELKPIIDAINSGLDKIKSHTQIVRRGAELPIKIEKQHCLGCTVKYPAYTSSSTTQPFLEGSLFLIKSKNGKYIAPLSDSPLEEEILFAPGTKFKVINIKSEKDTFDENFTKVYTMIEE